VRIQHSPFRFYHAHEITASRERDWKKSSEKRKLHGDAKSKVEFYSVKKKKKKKKKKGEEKLQRERFAVGF
jgi:hypothetical protein